MNIVLRTAVIASSFMVSVSSFAGALFYCPQPSEIHAVPATHPFPPEPGFNYVGTDAEGVTFESISPVIGDSAPELATFDSATWTNIMNGSASCFYKDVTGMTQALIAQTSQPVIHSGPNWSNAETPFYQCNTTDISACAFEFNS